jgi:hypothetical protein
MATINIQKPCFYSKKALLDFWQGFEGNFLPGKKISVFVYRLSSMGVSQL